MKEVLLPLILGLVLCAAIPSVALADELSGHIDVEGGAFLKDPLLATQERDYGSIALEAEYYHEWENGASFTFVPFGRFDSADSNRSHFDIRELNYLWFDDAFELRLGIGKVFWGATEFVHLADIVNQTDLVEDIDGEDKLGQPMLHLSMSRAWGIVDIFALPYFRERTLPGKDGRLRSAAEVDTDHAGYQSGAEQHHLDLALRYSHTIGNCDFGIYHFRGTGREPTLLTGVSGSGRPMLTPYYEQINQTGTDLQFVAGNWLFKSEGIYRTGQGDDFVAATGGLEYTFTAVADTAMDIGVIGEWAYDSRGDDATTSYENDAMLGLRLSANDAASSEFLAGIVQDVDTSTRFVSIEASRRMGSHWKMFVEGRAFLNVSKRDPSYGLRRDHYLKFGLAFYF